MFNWRLHEGLLKVGLLEANFEEVHVTVQMLEGDTNRNLI